MTLSGAEPGTLLFSSEPGMRCAHSLNIGGKKSNWFELLATHAVVGSAWNRRTYILLLHGTCYQSLKEDNEDENT